MEDFIITIIPVLFGDGLRLYGSLEPDADLELEGPKSIEPGLVQNHYRVVSE